MTVILRTKRCSSKHIIKAPKNTIIHFLAISFTMKITLFAFVGIFALFSSSLCSFSSGEKLIRSQTEKMEAEARKLDNAFNKLFYGKSHKSKSRSKSRSQSHSHSHPFNPQCFPDFKNCQCTDDYNECTEDKCICGECKHIPIEGCVLNYPTCNRPPNPLPSSPIGPNYQTCVLSRCGPSVNPPGQRSCDDICVSRIEGGQVVGYPICVGKFYGTECSYNSKMNLPGTVNGQPCGGCTGSSDCSANELCLGTCFAYYCVPTSLLCPLVPLPTCSTPTGPLKGPLGTGNSAAGTCNFNDSGSNGPFCNSLIVNGLPSSVSVCTNNYGGNECASGPCKGCSDSTQCSAQELCLGTCSGY